VALLRYAARSRRIRKSLGRHGDGIIFETFGETEPISVYRPWEDKNVKLEIPNLYLASDEKESYSGMAWT